METFSIGLRNKLLNSLSHVKDAMMLQGPDFV